MKKKYFGILPNFDFNEISLGDLNLLVELKVFYCRQFSDKYKDDDDYFPDDDYKMNFTDLYIQNGKGYQLHHEVYKEIYFLDAEKIKTQSELPYHIDKIDYEVDSEEYVGPKYSILEKYYKLYQDKIENIDLFLLYQGINTYETCGVTCNDFYDYYVEDFNANEDYTGVGDYLNGIDRFYNVEFRQEWEKMYLVREVCQFCLTKMKELRQLNTDIDLKESQDALAQKIFKDDGLKIFEHIVSKYQETKTRAFFSYLYFFLQSKSKILINKGDSDPYRDFVVNREYLPDFIKIQQSQSKSQGKKYIMEVIFEELLKSYSK
ncbi:hypothetical protein [Flavobacterium sp. SM2513]|uniref:hypothetical protein n=1 Tax=Flavobacterium sp. SM2513 TaxID=3424766 RepID=UPI003D7FC108